VKLQSYTQCVEDILGFNALYSADGSVTYRLRRHGLAKGQLVVSVDSTTSRTQAELLRNLQLYARREDFTALEDEDAFYISDLIGCDVVDATGSLVGVIKEAHNFGAGDILEIAPQQGASFMVLFTEANFPEVDCDARRLTYVPPEVIGAPPPKIA
jgi:16S rRNA processing protein RimM